MQVAHAFSFLLNVQQIGNFREVDKQIIINIDLDCGIKGILDVQHILLEVVDSYCFAARIYNPILTHSIIFVVVEFADIIICWITGGNNFNDKIWCTVAPFSVQLVFITYNHEVRLDNGKWSIIQFYIKWYTL